MKQFERDVLHWINYDYVVINDDLKTCYNNIINILDKEFNNKKSNYNKSSIKDHISKLI